jgi:hypothetical protein
MKIKSQIKNCKECGYILNDRRNYPKGWDKGLCESCNEYYEYGQLTGLSIEKWKIKENKNASHT